MDVLHCDLNNFYASVEQTINPALKGKAVAVSGNPETRSGIILAKNTMAKNMGVKTGEVIWQAKQKCPDLVCVPPHFEYYVHYSKAVRKIYEQYTDKVEGFGLDECWLDVTDSKIFGTPFEIAEKIRNQVREETGLTISVGVSFTKTFAKLGSDLKKPDATTEISKENYKNIVWPLPVQDMIFIGRQTQNKLNHMGIFNLGQLARASTKALVQAFGVVGERMQKSARGEDVEPVRNCDVQREIKSVSHGITTLRDMETFKDAHQVIEFLSDMVATRLRRYGFFSNLIHLDIRRNNLTHESRQCHVPPTNNHEDIFKAACRLLSDMWQTKQEDLPLRSLSVGAGGLTDVGGSVQLCMFDERSERALQLELSVDQIRKKFGFGAIKKASMLHCDLLTDKMFSEEDLLPFKR